MLRLLDQGVYRPLALARGEDVLAYALLYIIGTKAFEFEPDITSVGSWQWPVLMLVLMAAVLAAVSGWKIWQVMRLNPAEAIKTE